MSKTPDKIYIPGKWLHVPSNQFEMEDSPGATKYIRKDTLLEWAKVKRFEIPGSADVYQELISKLQEL